MDKPTRNRYLRRAAIPCTQLLALGGMFAFGLGLISGYQCLAAVVISFVIYLIFISFSARSGCHFGIGKQLNRRVELIERLD